MRNVKAPQDGALHCVRSIFPRCMKKRLPRRTVSAWFKVNVIYDIKYFSQWTHTRHVWGNFVSHLTSALRKDGSDGRTLWLQTDLLTRLSSLSVPCSASLCWRTETADSTATSMIISVWEQKVVVAAMSVGSITARELNGWSHVTTFSWIRNCHPAPGGNVSVTVGKSLKGRRTVIYRLCVRYGAAVYIRLNGYNSSSSCLLAAQRRITAAYWTWV